MLNQENHKKRILLVTRPICPPWDEGSKNFAYYLAKNIQNSEIHLMTKGKLSDLPESVVQHPIYTTSRVSEFDFFQKMRSLLFQFRIKGKFDVNQYFFTPTKLNSFFIKNFFRSSKTKTIQTIAALREDLWSDEDIKKLMFGDLIITYSDYSKNRLHDLGFQNVQRIYPGIDLEEFRFKEKNQELLQKYGINSEDFVINFTGEYSRLGAIDGVVETFANVSKEISQAKLFLAVRIKNEKDAKKKKEILEKIEKLGIVDKVSFHEDQKYKMADVYNLCDVSIFPVRDMKGKFDVPLAVIEAMACEKAMIISDLPVLREFANSENSVKIKPGNWKQLEEAIIDLCKNPEKRHKIGQAGRAYAEKYFNIKNVAQEYEKIYEQI
jgi:phosphatidylinositol alpha-1,6-mannosyltransferase